MNGMKFNEMNENVNTTKRMRRTSRSAIATWKPDISRASPRSVITALTRRG